MKDVERVLFRNMLMWVVGIEDDLYYFLVRYLVYEGEFWLLCFDGLYNVVLELFIFEWLNLDLSV